MKITLTTTQNQKNNKNISNITAIDLGICETLLRRANNLDENDILYIKKIDIL